MWNPLYINSELQLLLPNDICFAEQWLHLLLLFVTVQPIFQSRPGSVSKGRSGNIRNKASVSVISSSLENYTRFFLQGHFNLDWIPPLWTQCNSRAQGSGEYYKETNLWNEWCQVLMTLTWLYELMTKIWGNTQKVRFIKSDRNTYNQMFINISWKGLLWWRTSMGQEMVLHPNPGNALTKSSKTPSPLSTSAQLGMWMWMYFIFSFVCIYSIVAFVSKDIIRRFMKDPVNMGITSWENGLGNVTYCRLLTRIRRALFHEAMCVSMSSCGTDSG